jgi:rRNA maturation endonuclease Nob1
MDFESWSFRTETILLLPTSNKPVSDSDLKKIYCCECGRKLQKKYKFCPYCGAKID